MSGILIGTSGYDHPELKGSFYPSDLPRKDFLTFYSTKFNALEINSTFYGMPDSKRMLSFFERSEGRVKFSIKMNRLLTHEIDRNWKENARIFKEAVQILQEKDSLSTVLIQFPESFGYIPENRIYLAELLKSMEEVPCVVEFRHRDWIRESVFNGLQERNAGIVFCDMPECASANVKTPFIGPNAYVRFHGRNENGWYAKTPFGEETHRYDYEYSIEELQSFVPIIQKAVTDNKTIQLYFNNHPKGCGFKNALQLMEILGIQVKDLHSLF